jgi:sRNA-binding protein
VLERLFQLYPKLFGARFLPLKLGVFHDLLAAHPEAFNKDELKAALGVHARSTRYLEAVASGAKRHDLNGEPVEDVAPEHVHHAIMEVFRRRSARGKDAQAWLHQRLVAAIEAAGLPREDYEARVQVRDDAAMAALDAAFSEVREKTARREALRRAFEASGKSVDEFADMYGMKPGEVRQLLGAKPPARTAAEPAPEAAVAEAPTATDAPV